MFSGGGSSSYGWGIGERLRGAGLALGVGGRVIYLFCFPATPEYCSMQTSFRRYSVLFCVLPLVVGGQSVFAQESAAEKTFFFESKIRPLLVEHCYECHSQQSNSIKGGLSLDTRQAVAAGGDSGKVVVPFKPDESLLIKSVRYNNPDVQMPPKGRLTDAQIADLERWVRMGLPDPREGKAVPRTNAWDRQRGRSHWAFQHIDKPAIPAVRDVEWCVRTLTVFCWRRWSQQRLRRRGMRIVRCCCEE